MEEDTRHRSQIQERTALILYGSETGSAQDVAEEVGRLTERLRFTTRVASLDSVALADLLHPTILIFSISTTGQGDIPGNAQLFWKKLRSARLRPGCFASLRFTSFGLGDTSYPKYNWAHRKLYNRVKQLGGQPFCERGESDEQHPEGIDGCYLPWAIQLRRSLLNLFPLPAGTEPISEDEFLEPKWILNLERTDVFYKSLNGPTELAEIAIQDQTGKAPNHNTEMTSRTSLSEKSSTNESDKFTATLLKNKRVTPEDHWQDVRVFEFSANLIDYQPGDVLTIFPHNSTSDVDHFLYLNGWLSHADTPISFAPSSSSTNPSHHPSPLSLTSPTSPGQTITLRKFITQHLDINSIPRRSFFTSISYFTTDEMQKDRLLEFTNADYIDELFDYTTRPRRSIIEVLQEFDTVKIPLKWIASIIPTIHGRQFSIASGGALKRRLSDPTSCGCEETRIELLVAIVKYRTVIKKTREGLCTKYLANLRPGARLEVLLTKGGMKLAMDRPAVMIGPGTGIAPLRAMIHERAAFQAGNGTRTSEHKVRSRDADADEDADEEKRQRQLLFYGGRNRAADFFFEDEWKRLSLEVPPLNVFPAFSRDQDLIRKHAKVVFDTLKEGVVYICGSSGKMPQAVREALIEVFEWEGPMKREEAEAHLVTMEKNGRYQQETW